MRGQGYAYFPGSPLLLLKSRARAAAHIFDAWKKEGHGWWNQNKQMVALTICMRLRPNRFSWFSFEINSETEIQVFISTSCKWPHGWTCTKPPHVSTGKLTSLSSTPVRFFPSCFRKWSQGRGLKANCWCCGLECEAQQGTRYVGEDRCKQLLLHERNVTSRSKYTGWQEVTKEKRHSNERPRQREAKWQPGCWVWAEGALGL